MTQKYSDYLQSEQWAKKRLIRIEIDNGKCTMCGKSLDDDAQIHHFTYRNAMNENPWLDLTTLCDSCHIAVHTMMSRKTAPNRHGWSDVLPYGIRRSLIDRGLMA